MSFYRKCLHSLPLLRGLDFMGQKSGCKLRTGKLKQILGLLFTHTEEQNKKTNKPQDIKFG